jgi:hypothetical protein
MTMNLYNRVLTGVKIDRKTKGHGNFIQVWTSRRIITLCPVF